MRTSLSSWLFIFSLLLIGLNIFGVSSQCFGYQQALLIQLKNSLKFDHDLSTKLGKWNQHSDCCSWDGITCNNEGHVTGLSLSDESILGGILDNSSLFNLQHLNSLDLSFNNFNSTIPARIADLKTLSYLNLSNAGFRGQIPKEISQLTRLAILDLSTPLFFLGVYSLKLEDPNLRMLVQNLSKLEELYLDGINISAPGTEWCQALSSSVPKLRVLSLTNCYLSGPIDESLEKLQSLSVIRLDNNDLSATVPGFFSNFPNLTSLGLSSCGLNGTFPPEIFQVPTLQIIDVSDNVLLQGSLPEFLENNALQSLVLKSTNFRGSLPISIGNLWNLSGLDLSNCKFNGMLPSSMEKLTKLVYLDLSINNFSGQIPSFKMSKNLAELVLSHNSLTGTISSIDWKDLLKLVVVDLRDNSLNGKIPSSLFALPSLKVIQLSNNQLEGQLPEFRNISSSVLDALDLRSNNLDGPIPASMFELQKLSILALSSNKLNGTIHLQKIHGLHNLTTLDLSYNNLSVIVSENDPSWPFFSKISRLKLASCKLRMFPYLKNQLDLLYLDLSNNQLNGTVPNWIWDVGNGFLQHLNLSHNFLGGIQEPYSLPKFISVLDLHLNQIQGKIPVLTPSISYIDLSSNNFTSYIPPDIGNQLNFTIFFSLANNFLTGVIPDSICNARCLQVLDLSNNSLSGRLPECISSMSQGLGVLNLRRNRLTGRIPDAFPVNCGLMTLDLYENLIEEQIPKSLANCNELEVLNLGNNNLTGEFPCLLRNISNLRVLVLRSNRFYGEIGCPKINGSWARLQIVDLALNNFKGKLPGDRLTNWQAMMAGFNDSQSELNHLRFEVLRFTEVYYQDAITVTSKGLQMELVKILTVFTLIDFSCNHFVGPIPEVVGSFRALHVLNLSSNALTGEIPSSIGNLSNLESLDLSRNKLSGPIPTSLRGLTFLSFLNLSFNQLVGEIPSGAQFQTFSPDSFIGNKGLCGFPLTVNYTSGVSLSNTTKGNDLDSGNGIDWNLIVAEIGFIVGFGVMVLPLVFCKRWRKLYFEQVDNVGVRIFPRLYETSFDKNRRPSRLWFF